MKANLTKPVKQHYVPRAYLNKFAGKNNHLFYLDVKLLQAGKNVVVKSKGSKGLCTEERIYSLSECKPGYTFNFNQYDDLFVESKVLKSLEDVYPELFEKLTLNNVISIDTALRFTDFIIQLKKRNPYNKKFTIESNQKNWIAKIGSGLKEDIMAGNTPFPNIPESVKIQLTDIMLNEINNDDGFSRKALMHSLISDYEGIGLNRSVRKALLNHDWLMLRAPVNGPFFITSDNPGCSRESSTKKIYNTKFISPFDFYLPLSPRFCFSVSSDFPANTGWGPSLKPITHIPVREIDVIGINDCLIQCINKIIIGHDDWYLKQIRQLNFKHA